MKAVILAAGEGRRLAPLTNRRPKPMIPIANRPLLEHVVGAVADAGLEEVVLVVGYKRERIQSHFGDGDDWDVDIEYAVQEKQLGTGDAVLQAEPHVEGEFLVLNGDRIIEADLIAKVARERRETGETLMAVTGFREPELYGVVDVEGDRVVSIREKPPAHETGSDLINAGVYGVGPDVFDAIRATEFHGELALTETLAERLEDHPIRAVPYRGWWLDVTRPWDLLEVNSRVLEDGRGGDTADALLDEAATTVETAAIGGNAAVGPGARVLHGTAIGENSRVGPNAVVTNSLVLPDATIGAGAVVTDCVVGANATIGANATVEGGAADVTLGDTVHRDVRFGGMIGDDARIGAGATVAPGALIGDDAEAEGGTRLSGRIEPGTEVRRG